VDIIFGDENPAGPRGRSTGSFEPAKCPWNTDSFGSAKHSRYRNIDSFSFTNSTTEPATQAVQHSTSGPKDIRIQAFIADSDPVETGRRWKKWKNELLTRFRYFRTSNTQDRIDALHIYG